MLMTKAELKVWNKTSSMNATYSMEVAEISQKIAGGQSEN